LFRSDASVRVQRLRSTLANSSLSVPWRGCLTPCCYLPNRNGVEQKVVRCSAPGEVSPLDASIRRLGGKGSIKNPVVGANIAGWKRSGEGLKIADSFWGKCHHSRSPLCHGLLKLLPLRQQRYLNKTLSAL